MRMSTQNRDSNQVRSRSRPHSNLEPSATSSTTRFRWHSNGLYIRIPSQLQSVEGVPRQKLSGTILSAGLFELVKFITKLTRSDGFFFCS
ncbi:hypothetical protein CH063_09534 [Colletotrichum higginsianum]|uniref:Uncharacterized protein n=1 Tax=Colletotrichum higginsianum (strain IMI 349063) TaxID=759273 RepID=H1VDZ3_COLHI|nr:hypothetical protein CH063_09534 [Colletotrichum higginsianum]